MPEIAGIVGNGLLAACGIPQAWRSYRTKRAADISWLFLSMWGCGELLQVWYCAWPMNWPIFTNALVNICAVSVIAYYKAKVSDHR